MAEALRNMGDFVEFVQESLPSTPLPKVWYMLRLHPNYDLRAERQLLSRGFSAYVPKEVRTIKGSWNRRISRTVPIFPGAMFVPDRDADLTRLKRACDGIGGFVKYCGEALKISLRTMDEVRRFEAKRNGLPEQRKFHINQKIRVVGGPFDMLEGRIDRLDNRYRISVLIEFLGASTTIQMDEDSIEAV